MRRRTVKIAGSMLVVVMVLLNAILLGHLGIDGLQFLVMLPAMSVIEAVALALVAATLVTDLDEGVINT